MLFRGFLDTWVREWLQTLFLRLILCHLPVPARQAWRLALEFDLLLAVSYAASFGNFWQKGRLLDDFLSTRGYAEMPTAFGTPQGLVNAVRVIVRCRFACAPHTVTGERCEAGRLQERHCGRPGRASLLRTPQWGSLDPTLCVLGKTLGFQFPKLLSPVPATQRGGCVCYKHVSWRDPSSSLAPPNTRQESLSSPPPLCPLKCVPFARDMAGMLGCCEPPKGQLCFL